MRPDSELIGSASICRAPRTKSAVRQPLTIYRPYSRAHPTVIRQALRRSLARTRHRPPRLHRHRAGPARSSRPATTSSGSTRTCSPPACSATTPAEVESLRKDVRDVEVADLEGFDAVLHLAAVCNDPVGDLNPQTTYDINQLASARLAEKAKQAGVDALRVLLLLQPLRQGAGDDALDETRRVRAGDAVRPVEGARRAGHLAARRRHLQPDLPAQRDRLRRLAAPAPRRRGQQPRRLGAHDRRDRAPERRHAVAPARAHRGHLRARSWPCSRPRASSCTTRRSTSARPPRTTRSARSPRSSRRSPARARDVRRGRRRARHALLPRRLLEARARAARRAPQWTVRRGAEELRAPTPSGA